MAPKAAEALRGCFGKLYTELHALEQTLASKVKVQEELLDAKKSQHPIGVLQQRLRVYEERYRGQLQKPPEDSSHRVLEATRRAQANQKQAAEMHELLSSLHQERLDLQQQVRDAVQETDDLELTSSVQRRRTSPARATPAKTATVSVSNGEQAPTPPRRRQTNLVARAATPEEAVAVAVAAANSLGTRVRFGPARARLEALANMMKTLHPRLKLLESEAAHYQDVLEANKYLREQLDRFQSGKISKDIAL